MSYILPTSKQIDQIFIYDSEGAGRCWIGAAMVEYGLKKRGIDIPVIPVGLGLPKSGRITINEDVAQLIFRRYHRDLSGSLTTKLDSSMLTDKTLALGLTHDRAPNFINEKVLDHFLGGVMDPFPNLEKNLDPIATQIYYCAWMLETIITKMPKKIGARRDERGFVVPSFLSELDNISEEFYSRGVMGLEYSSRASYRNFRERR